MKIWTVGLSFIGLVLGVIFSTQTNEFYGFNSIDDLLYSLLISLPFLMLGFVIGFCVDFFSISDKDKKLAQINSTSDTLKVEKERESNKT
jgi:hypothetical protein